MITHSVIYTLKHPAGSAEEQDFQQTIAGLAQIPTVRNLRRHRQVSPKNKFSFGLSMEFASKEDYQAYNLHPIHTAFVAKRWVPEVADFLEIDYTNYEGA